MTRPARLRLDLPVGSYGPRRTLALAPSERLDTDSEAVSSRRTCRMLVVALVAGLLMWAGIITVIVLLVGG